MYSKYETTFELAYTSFKVEKYLQGKGYNAVATYNLTGIGGDMGTPRGALPDAFCNQLEAVEAGLGQLTVNGMCYTEEHGFSQDFIAIVTDAPLDALREECERLSLDYDKILAETDGTTLAEGLYIKIEENGSVSDRMKYVRHGYTQTAAVSDGDWKHRPVIPNRKRRA